MSRKKLFVLPVNVTASFTLSVPFKWPKGLQSVAKVSLAQDEGVFMPPCFAYAAKE